MTEKTPNTEKNSNEIITLEKKLLLLIVFLASVGCISASVAMEVFANEGEIFYQVNYVDAGMNSEYAPYIRQIGSEVEIKKTYSDDQIHELLQTSVFGSGNASTMLPHSTYQQEPIVLMQHSFGQQELFQVDTVSGEVDSFGYGHDFQVTPTQNVLLILRYGDQEGDEHFMELYERDENNHWELKETMPHFSRVSFSSNEQILARFRRDSASVELYDRRTGEVVNEFKMEGFPAAIQPLNDGRTLLSIYQNNLHVQMISEANEMTDSILAENVISFRSIDDDRLLLYLTRNWEFFVYSPETGRTTSIDGIKDVEVLRDEIVLHRDFDLNGYHYFTDNDVPEVYSFAELHSLLEFSN